MSYKVIYRLEELREGKDYEQRKGKEITAVSNILPCHILFHSLLFLISSDYVSAYLLVFLIFLGGNLFRIEK